MKGGFKKKTSDKVIGIGKGNWLSFERVCVCHQGIEYQQRVEGNEVRGQIGEREPGLGIKGRGNLGQEVKAHVESPT